MRTPGRLRTWLLYPVRTPRRAVLTALLLAAAGAVGWYAERVVRFNRSREAAERALAGYDFPAARRRLAECVRLRPDDPAVRLLAAQAARRDGALDEAQAHLDRHRDLAGSTPEGLLEESMLLAQQGQVEQVVDYLMDLADHRHPAAEQILEALAVGCVHVYRLDRAAFWVQYLLQQAPGNPIGLLVLGETAETLRQRDRAMETFRKLVDRHPGFARGRLALAQALLRARQYEEAAGHYEVLHRDRPDDVVPLLGLARCLAVLDRVEEARPLMRELRERHADNSEALLAASRFALREGRPEEAEPLLRRAAELAPNDHEVRLQFGVALQQLGRAEEAAAHLERARQIEADLALLEKAVAAMVTSPADPGPRLEAARICLRNGQDAEGLRWLHGALQLAPDHEPTHRALADYFAAHGNPQQAAYHRQRSR